MPYQTHMFAELDADIALDPNVVFLADSRWPRAVQELQAASWVGIDSEFYSTQNGTWKRRDINYWRASVRLIQIQIPSGLCLVFNLGGILDDRAAAHAAHHDALLSLKVVLENPVVPKVGMNLLTDYLIFRIHFGWQMRCTRDVMLMSQVVWAGLGTKGGRWTETGIEAEPVLYHNLGAICDRCKIPIDKTEQKSDWAGKLTNRQFNYAARDVAVLHPVWRRLAQLAKEGNVLRSLQAECDAQPAFGECEYNGLPIDLAIARADLATWETVRTKFLQPFSDLFPGVNESSPKQVARVLTDALDISECKDCGAQYDPMMAEPRGTPMTTAQRCWCGAEFSRIGKRIFFQKKQVGKKWQDQPVTSDDALVPYKDVWYVHALLEARSTSACMNWLRAAVEHAFDAGNGGGMRIRADFKQIAGGYSEHGTEAGETGRGMGRSSASRPINTQNPSNLQPAHEAMGAVSVRNCIRPAPGRAFIVADLSQAHARIAAQWSQDPVMLRDFNAGRDFHLAMTHRLMEKKDVQLDGHTITLDDVIRVNDDKRHPVYRDLRSRRQGCKSTNYAKLNMSGVKTLKGQMATMPVPILMDDEEVADLIQVWNGLYAVLYKKQREHVKLTNSYRHSFKELGLNGEYGESRGLTGRRLYLVKEWKRPWERPDGTWSQGWRWSVKATDAVSFIWMSTEADLIKHAMGQLVGVADAHPEWGVRWCNMAHDELNWDVREDYAVEAATAIQTKMDAAMVWAGIVDLPVNEKDTDPRRLIKQSWAAK